MKIISAKLITAFLRQGKGFFYACLNIFLPKALQLIL